ncbi:Uu.00g003740.m01.CDS01 [Anthostomella pinea]|uniref:Uu.00g003740.m01.CDS01 n=1 Tax=Anthostomella pinea TaxID=933095 RepID=A0AAI8VJV2_9PEZI|nr:Uu.00g003740.m01.CDS01 [Anthostomella pinea]
MPETIGPAFPDRATPLLSYNIPFTESLLKHAESTFHHASKNTGHLDDVKRELGRRLAGARVGMKPHSHWDEILEVVADASACGADLIVTLGAGSLTNAAKVVSFALANDVSAHEEINTICPTSPHKRTTINPSAIPVICIPTSLSGGEYSAFAGATNERDGRKYSFSGGGMRGPALLGTGIMAVDHCVETLCSLGSDDAADADARRGLARLVPALLRCREDAGDLEARLQCMLGAKDAMSASGHQLGPAGVGHSETSCILNPAVCKFNYAKRSNVERQDAICKLLWDDPKAVGVFEKVGLKRGSAELGDPMDAIICALFMPRTLREFGIGEDKLDGIAEHSLTDRWVKTNPAPLDKKGVLEILRMVLG